MGRIAQGEKDRARQYAPPSDGGLRFVSGLRTPPVDRVSTRLLAFAARMKVISPFQDLIGNAMWVVVAMPPDRFSLKKDPQKCIRLQGKSGSKPG